MATASAGMVDRKAQRQGARRLNGRYERMNVCVCCDRPMGDDYLSIDLEGRTVAPAACNTCWKYAQSLTVAQYASYAKARSEGVRATTAAKAAREG